MVQVPMPAKGILRITPRVLGRFFFFVFFLFPCFFSPWVSFLFSFCGLRRKVPNYKARIREMATPRPTLSLGPAQFPPLLRSGDIVLDGLVATLVSIQTEEGLGH